MDIKELNNLCSKYLSNENNLQFEEAFKERVVDKWAADSGGMELINSKIANWTAENEIIKQKILKVANVKFN